MAGGDTSFRQSAATEFLVNQEIQISDNHAHFNECMEKPTWALSVSDDRNGILKTAKPTTTISPVLAGRKLTPQKIGEFIREDRQVTVREI
jgi:hypothetical protein